MQKTNQIKILLLLNVLIISAFAHEIEMREYNPGNKPFITQEIKANREVLIPETPDYDIDFFLDTKTPSPIPYYAQYTGKVIIKVLYYNNQEVGFGSCYMRTKKCGDIIFVAVNENFRGKRLAEIIIKTQIDDLKKQGAQRVELWVVKANEPACKLYTRLGFKESTKDKDELCMRLFKNID